MDDKRIGAKISERREYLGWSQEELAAKMNVARATISRWEGGSRGVSAPDLIRLERVLGVTSTYFRERADDHSPMAEIVLEELRGAAYDDGMTIGELAEIRDYIQTKREMTRRRRDIPPQPVDYPLVGAPNPRVGSYLDFPMRTDRDEVVPGE